AGGPGDAPGRLTLVSSGQRTEQANGTVEEEREEPGAANAVPGRRDRGAAVETIFAALSSALAFALFLLLPVYLWPALLFSGLSAVRLAHARGAGLGLVSAALTALILGGLAAVSGGSGSVAGTAIASVVCFGLPVGAVGLVRRG